MRDRRPIRADGKLGRREARVLFGGVHNPATHYGQHGFEALDFFLRDREVIAGKTGQVCKLPGSESSLLPIFGGEPTASKGVKLQRLRAVEAIFLAVQSQSADCLAGNEPVKGEEGVITGDSRGIGSCPYRCSHLQHPSYRWCALRLLSAISFHEVLALESHAILHRDAAPH